MSTPPPRIRILRVIARLNVGGPARHLGWLTSGLDPERHEQLLLTGQVEPGEEDLGPALAAGGLRYQTVKGLGRSLHPIKDLACLLRLLWAMIRFRPHIIETHTAKAGFLGRAAALLYRPYAWLTGGPVPKTIHVFHGHVFHGYFSPAMTRLFLALERLLARTTWRIQVLSQRQLEEINGTFKVGRAEQFVLTPLGLDPGQFVGEPADRARFRAELGVAGDEVLVGAVGRVAPVKDYPLMVRAMARLKEDHPRVYERCRFVIIGGGREEDLGAIQGLAWDADVAERLILAGGRDDPRAFYGGLDVLLLTSKNEGTPLVILEAGLNVKPVLASQVGGVPDLLGPTQRHHPGGFASRLRGFTFPAGGAAQCAAALAWLLDDPDGRAQAQRAADTLAAYVLQRHHKDRLATDMARLYQEAVGAGGRSWRVAR